MPSSSALAHPPPEIDPLEERRSRILDAAERCFVRTGFHRTTMQDIAAEASMSPGNLYRYFASKDAVAGGLAERDRAEVRRDFAETGDAPDLLAAFDRIARKHFVEAPAEKAVLCLEIWAEATRNPAFAEVSAGFERDILGRLTTLIEEARGRGEVAAGVDPHALALLIMTIANGLFVRRAVARSYDAEREVAGLNAVIRAAFAGRIELEPFAARPSGAAPALAEEAP